MWNRISNSQLGRFVSQHRNSSNQNSRWEEVRIPVPWGHIAGKWWGPRDKRPILATHGWQDNSGTFDTLIPQLPSNLSYLAIDFPGHGFSSPLPPGIFYHGIDNVIVLRRIAEHFKWRKISLMGHSMGATLNYLFAVLYPDKVDFLISFDSFKPLIPENRIERAMTAINLFLKYEKFSNSKEDPPSYEYSILEKMLHDGTEGSILLENCKYILERNIAPSAKDPNKYYFKRDSRLKAGDVLTWSQEDVLDSVVSIRCPVFFSKASHSPFFEKKEYTLEVIELLKKNNTNFEFHNVEGTHHVHLNHPERLSGLISNFISKYDLGDRAQADLEDNSGTFDTLIPQLPSNLAYLAIDFPGHGLSSQLPSGVYYHGIDTVTVVRRIVEHFKWPKVSLMGHSLGAILNYTFTVLYPDKVDFLICMDGFKPLVFTNKKIERMMKTIDSFLKYDKLNNSKEEPPCYEYSVLEQMLHDGTRGSILLENCKYILERNIAPSSKDLKKYFFKRDPRLKAGELLGWSQEDILDNVLRIKCPIFLSKASHSPFFERKENALEVLEVVKKNNKNFEFHNVDGTHHVHLNYPERLSGLISNFINKYDIGDRTQGGLAKV